MLNFKKISLNRLNACDLNELVTTSYAEYESLAYELATNKEKLSFVAGWVLLWVMTDWPIGVLGSGYLLSAHMLQYVIYSLVIAPLLVGGISNSMVSGYKDQWFFITIRSLISRPFVCFVAFNIVLAITHIPYFTDILKPLQLGQMLIDILWISVAILFWAAIGTFDDAVAVSSIFINTNLAAAGGVMAAAIITRLMFGKTDVIQMLNGAIGGLVAVTAEPLAPSPLAAIFIGAVGGLIVVFGTKLLFSFKLDDVVGAIPAHMFAGIWGTLAVPLTNTDASFSAQLIGVLSINIFVFVVSYIVFSAMKATFGIRLSKEAEAKGTDVTETGVIAYAIRD